MMMTQDPKALAGGEGGEGGEGASTPEDLVTEINSKAKDARQARQGWIDEAKECRRFVAGDQFNDEEKRILQEQKRPPVVFNRVGPVVDVVGGLEVSNRQEVRYIPRELGDAGLNEVLTGAAKWVRDECNAEDEESEAFLDMTITGEGWSETRLDYEYDQDGAILIERVDPLEMLPDPASTKKNYRDAEWLIREKMVRLSWVKDTWPDKADEIAMNRMAESDGEFEGESIHRNVVGDQYQSPQATSRGKSYQQQVKLTEYQYKKREAYYRVQHPMTGEVTEISDEQHATLQERAKALFGAPMKSVKQTKCVYYRAFVVGDVLLENDKCPDPSSFTYKAMTAKRDAAKGCWYGIVRGMLDPQRWANKFFSQSMFILNVNAKGGVLVERDAVDKAADFERSWANPQAITWVEPGANTQGKILPKQPPAFPPELSNLTQFAIQSIRDVSGVSVELLGMADREQPASLEYQRKQAGVTILATLFDALRKYRKEQGRTLLYLIENYLSDGRLVRIVGDTGQQYIPLVRQQADNARYDVIIDEGPNSPNMKEKTWAILQSLLPMLVQAGVQIPPEVINYLPLPQSFIDAMKKPNPQREQEAQMQKQMMMQEKQADTAKTQAQAALAAAQAKLAEAQAAQAQVEASLQGQQLQSGDQKLLHEMQLKTQQAQREQEIAVQNVQLEAWKAQQDIQLKREVAAANLQLQQQKTNFDAHIAKQKADYESAVTKGLPEVNKANQSLGELMTALSIIHSAPDEIIRDPQTGAVMGKQKKLSKEQMAKIPKDLHALLAPKAAVRDENGNVVGVH